MFTEPSGFRLCMYKMFEIKMNITQASYQLYTNLVIDIENCDNYRLHVSCLPFFLLRWRSGWQCVPRQCAAASVFSDGSWWTRFIRGGIIIKNGKIADFFPNRLDPPPLPSDISDFFEFQTYLKNADPPYRINLRHFWIWEHIDGGRTTRINISKGLFRHIYIEKGQIKCFNFSFLGWGLIIETFLKIWDPPHRFSNVRIWIWDIFVFFSDPLFGTLSQIFLFFYYDASP